jgi:hypothetical protein
LYANFLSPPTAHTHTHTHTHSHSKCSWHSCLSPLIYINLTSNFAIQQLGKWSRCSESNHGLFTLLFVNILQMNKRNHEKSVHRIQYMYFPVYQKNWLWYTEPNESVSTDLLNIGINPDSNLCKTWHNIQHFLYMNHYMTYCLLFVMALRCWSTQ